MWAVTAAAVAVLLLVVRGASASPPDESWRVAYSTVSATGGYTAHYVGDLNGSGERLIMGSGERIFSFHCSPEGTHFAFYTNSGVWTMHVGDAEPRRLTLDLPFTFAAHLRLAGGGRSATLSQGGQIALIDAGAERVDRARVSTQPGVIPALSPDGTLLVYGALNRGELSLHIADLSGRLLLPPVHPQTWNFEPSWSPDGSRIAFAAQETNGTTDIYILDVAHGYIWRLTDDEHTDRAPVWSPDGEYILFLSYRDGVGGELYLMHWEGGEPQRLTRDYRLNFDACFLVAPPESILQAQPLP